eukprot:4108315-Alexandrium_andersonii.AAC.1
MLSLKTGPRAINLFSVYAPHAARPLIERQGYYEDLGNIMSRHDTDGVAVLVGDMNARISE